MPNVTFGFKEDIQNRYTAAPRACKKPSLRDRPLQIPRTAAGFEPMPCKKHTEKVPNVTFGIH